MSNKIAAKLAKALSLYAQIEGMKALNTERLDKGHTIAYGEEAFLETSTELLNLSIDLEGATTRWEYDYQDMDAYYPDPSSWDDSWELVGFDKHNRAWFKRPKK